MNGEYLKQLRIEKGMTQDELAKALGYSDRSVISRIEKNDIHLTQDKIKQYADFFNMSVLDIFGVKDDPNGPEAEFLSIFRQLNEQGRTMVLEYMEWLLIKYNA